MNSTFQMIEDSRNILKKIYQSLFNYFKTQGRILYQIEVWSSVLFLKFTKGRCTFFSKKQACEIAHVTSAKLNLIGTGTRHVDLNNKTNTITQAAVIPANIEMAMSKALGLLKTTY